jgi:hypothetical protein
MRSSESEEEKDDDDDECMNEIDHELGLPGLRRFEEETKSLERIENFSVTKTHTHIEGERDIHIHTHIRMHTQVGRTSRNSGPCVTLKEIADIIDDSFLFLNVQPNDIAKAMDVWGVFALATSLRINMQKSLFIRCTEQDFALILVGATNIG